jgi:hypothetical protein
MTRYESIACDADQIEAARAIDRLEEVSRAVDRAAQAAREAAQGEDDGAIGEALSTLAEILGDALSDAALVSHIRRIDAALAAYANNGFRP